MSGGTQVGRTVTYSCENFKENPNNVDGEDHKEVGCGIFNKPVDEVWHTLGSDTTSSICRIEHDEECRGIFDENGLPITINANTGGQKRAYHTLARLRRR